MSYNITRKIKDYLLIPWSRVLEKINVSLLVKNSPAFYGT
jgi:hypothetical protein